MEWLDLAHGVRVGGRNMTGPCAYRVAHVIPRNATVTITIGAYVDIIIIIA